MDKKKIIVDLIFLMQSPMRIHKKKNKTATTVQHLFSRYIVIHLSMIRDVVRFHCHFMNTEDGKKKHDARSRHDGSMFNARFLSNYLENYFIAAQKKTEETSKRDINRIHIYFIMHRTRTTHNRFILL